MYLLLFSATPIYRADTVILWLSEPLEYKVYEKAIFMFFIFLYWALNHVSKFFHQYKVAFCSTVLVPVHLADTVKAIQQYQPHHFICINIVLIFLITIVTLSELWLSLKNSSRRRTFDKALNSNFIEL